MSDFATCYVSLIQIWKTEYTRTQLPGPPEVPVSPGQDRAERDGNVTGSRTRYAHRYCFFVNNQMMGQNRKSDCIKRNDSGFCFSKRAHSLSN